MPPTDDIGVLLTLKANINALLQAACDEVRKGYPCTPSELERDSGVGKSTIYRVLHKKPKNIGVDKLELIAKALGVPAWALLLPGLSVTSPPVAGTRAQLNQMAEKIAEELVQEALVERRRLREESEPGRGGVADPFATSQNAKKK